MLEKLIENWLDSAGERTYQAVFCQMLTKQGYAVIHSTRHCPIEYGKDVIAIHPDGTPCAFQLKGNGGSRLTLTQFRNIQPQLFELINQQIEHPAVSKEKQHRSYLVTNGEVEEEVQQAVEQLNANNVRSGFPERIIQIIARGQLLSWAKELDVSLWPSELEDTKKLFEILTHKGNELFPVKHLHLLLHELLVLDIDAPKLKVDDFFRRANSAALLTAICLSPFSKTNNHFAIITAWTMFAVYLIGSAERSDHASKIASILALAEKVILDGLVDLMKEVVYRESPLAEGDKLSDFVAYKWRYTLLVSLASLTYCWLQKTESWPDKNFEEKLKGLIPINQDGLDLWGDGAVPQFLLHARYLETQGGSLENILTNLISQILQSSVPNIYADIEMVVEDRLSEILTDFSPQFKKETPTRNSWSIRQIILLMANKQMKDACIELWPAYSKVDAHLFIPQEKWMFCLFNSGHGKNMQYVPKAPERWDGLVEQSNEAALDFVPSCLLGKTSLLWLWLVICPQRAMPAVINHLFKEAAN